MTQKRIAVKGNYVFKNHYGSSCGYTKVKLAQDLRLMRRLDECFSEIEGQDHACQEVKAYLFDILHRTREKGVGGCILFAGAPAVGKTMVAEKVAEALGYPYLRLDMSGYGDKESSVHDFKGINPSYKEADRGVVTGFVLDHPCSVILFDEIEKAHPNVLKLLLQVLERGELEDACTKQMVSFRDVILIATTNAGSEIYDKALGRYTFCKTPQSAIIKAMKRDVNPTTGLRSFSEPLVSRFSAGRLIMFNKLRPEVEHRIVASEIRKQLAYYSDIYGLSFSVDEGALAKLLILNQGEAADIRTYMKAGSEHLRLGRIAESVSEQGEDDSFSCLAHKIDLADAEPQAKALLEEEAVARILVYGDESSRRLFRSGSPGRRSKKTEYLFADKDTKLSKLSHMDLSAAIIYIGEDRDPSFARQLFDAAVALEDIPVYVYTKRAVGRSEFFYYHQNGATGCYSPALYSRGLDRWVADIEEGLTLSCVTRQLFRSGKILGFDTDYRYDRQRRSVTVTVHNLRIVAAIEGQDEDTFVSAREIPNVSFDDIVGADTAKQELKSAARYITRFKEYRRAGMRIPRGLLLDGSPGTGKTMLAKAFAAYAQLPFIQMNATSFLHSYVGQGAAHVRHVFATARKYAPAVIFVDEIDAIARSRTGRGAESRHTDDLTNAFLSELDGFADHSGAPVFVIAATNFSTRKEDTLLDEAFLSRFDRRIHVSLPDLAQRETFLRMETAKLDNVSVSREMYRSLAKRSVGWSPRELCIVVHNGARLYEAAHSRVGLDDSALKEAFESHNDGEAGKPSAEALERSAYHEAGHAVVAYALGIPPVFTTVVARSNYGGYVYTADEEKTGYTKEELLNRICMALAGRAGEVARYGEGGISTGASGDFRSASRMAQSMIGEYGMDEELFLYADGEDRAALRERAQAVMKEQYARAVELVAQKMPYVRAVAKALIEKNSLDDRELSAIMSKKLR